MDPDVAIFKSVGDNIRGARIIRSDHRQELKQCIACLWLMVGGISFADMHCVCTPTITSTGCVKMPLRQKL